MAANLMNSMYDVSLAQATNMIRLCGGTNTVLLQGHMGTGKSSVLKALGKLLPDHVMCYFDCTTKDLGDIAIPQMLTIDGQGYVKYVTHEELGLHLGKDLILMVDEYGKANPAVKNAMLRLMLERKLGSYTLTPSSIIFATTNLGAEGVGDLVPPHARNRMTILRVRKSTMTEWIEDYAIEAGVNPVLIAWGTENPGVFASFEDVAKPEDNENIYHPNAPSRVSFVTPRSLALASFWLDARESMTDHELTAALVGTVGHAAAGSLAAYVRVAEQMPKLQEIKDNPLTAKVPDNKTVMCMVVHRSLQALERNWTDAWMDYLVRLPMEAQGMFANAVRRSVEKKQSSGNKRLMEVNTNKKYMDWCLKNNHMFTADKK